MELDDFCLSSWETPDAVLCSHTLSNVLKTPDAMLTLDPPTQSTGYYGNLGHIEDSKEHNKCENREHKNDEEDRETSRKRRRTSNKKVFSFDIEMGCTQEFDSISDAATFLCELDQKHRVEETMKKALRSAIREKNELSDRYWSFDPNIIVERVFYRFDLRGKCIQRYTSLQSAAVDMQKYDSRSRSVLRKGISSALKYSKMFIGFLWSCDPAFKPSVENTTRPVYCFNLSAQFITTYDSIGKAAGAMVKLGCGFYSSNTVRKYLLSALLTGRSFNSFYWSYTIDSVPIPVSNTVQENKTRVSRLDLQNNLVRSYYRISDAIRDMHSLPDLTESAKRRRLEAALERHSVLDNSYWIYSSV